MPDRSGVVPHAGVDMGQTDDLACVAYCWRLGDILVADRDKDGIPKQSADGSPILVPKPTFAMEYDIFCAGANARLKRAPFVEWVDQGLLTVTDSEWTDPEVIYPTIAERVKRHGVATMAFDPNNTREMALRVQADYGIEPFMFQQSARKYNEPLREFKRAMVEGRMYIPASALLEWCFRNVIETKSPQGHTMPDKAKSPDKIDPFVAGLMAYSEATFAPPKKTSVYDRRGALTF